MCKATLLKSHMHGCSPANLLHIFRTSFLKNTPERLLLFLTTYKKGINYAPIINRINHLSEKVLCSKDDETVTEIYLKSMRIKKKVTLAV